MVEIESRVLGMPTVRFTVDVDLEVVIVLLFGCENSPEISLSQSRRSWEKGGVGITGKIGLVLYSCRLECPAIRENA